MSGNNLFVLKNGMIAFSRYLYRDNRTLTALPLSEMFSLDTGKMSFPLATQGVTLRHSGDNGLGNELDNTIGPIAATFGPFGDIAELSRSASGVEFISFRAQENTDFTKLGCYHEQQIYVRSPNWCVEVAANTAAMIYNDVEKIFEEAYYSVGMTPPPYYVVSVKNLKSALCSIFSIVEMAIEKFNNPDFSPTSPENIERVYRKYEDNHEGFIKDLKFIYSLPTLKDVVFDMLGSILMLRSVNDLFEPVIQEQQDVHEERTGTSKKRNTRTVPKPSKNRGKAST